MADMDVDPPADSVVIAPSGSSKVKKRFEVKKVRPRVQAPIIYRNDCVYDASLIHQSMPTCGTVNADRFLVISGTLWRYGHGVSLECKSSSYSKLTSCDPSRYRCRQLRHLQEPHHGSLCVLFAQPSFFVTLLWHCVKLIP